MEVSSNAIHESSEHGAVKSILERRVPQIVGIYIGAFWTFFGFVQWMVDRYVLSPHLEELVLIAAVLFLPSVILLAYGHGAPGRNVWRKSEKIGLLCNVVIAAVVLFFLFSNKDLGSAQKTVQIIDADGNEVERLIPKEAFRKRIALFYFENISGDTALDWMRQAIPEAFDADLDQDLFLTAQSPTLFYEKLQKAGFKEGLGLPMALKRNLTREYNLNYFVSGIINKQADQLIVTTTLHEVKSGKEVSAHTYTATDIFQIIDQMSVDLKTDLDLPKKHIEDTVDLPVSEILTGSVEALKAYGNGIKETVFDRDFPEALESFEKATKDDPTFAMAHVQKYALLLQQGQMQPAMQALQAAQQHNYRLTEQIKFLLKVGQLNLGGNQEQALEAANQWRTLYPDDIQAHQTVALLYTIRNRNEEAIEAYQRLLQIDPSQANALLEMGRLLKDSGKPEEAIAQYEQFNKQYPDRNNGYNQLAQVYFEQGDLDKELEIRNIALSITPDDPGAFRQIGDVLKRKGEFEDAFKQYQTALSHSNTPGELMQTQKLIGDYYWLRGQYNDALVEYEKALSLVKENFPAMFYTVEEGRLAEYFYDAGQKDRVHRFLEEALASPATRQFPDLMVLISQAASHVYAKEGNVQEALDLIDEANQLVEASNFLLLVPQIHMLKGLVFKEAGRYAEAKEQIEKFLDAKKTVPGGWNRLGEVQIALGEFDLAKQSFNNAMQQFPSSPLSHLGMAKIALAQGNTAEASAHLDKALMVWENADERCAPAAEARSLKNSISNT